VLVKSSGFITLHHVGVELLDITRLIKEFIEEDPQNTYSLTIGTDSESKQLGNKTMHELITAIVIHRKGYGGRYFYRKLLLSPVKTLREKIYREVLTSVEIAQDLTPYLKKYLNGHSNYNLEIHIDVGENGKTKNVITEVVGIVTGSGFVARTKPFSYAASNIADRHA